MSRRRRPLGSRQQSGVLGGEKGDGARGRRARVSCRPAESEQRSEDEEQQVEGAEEASGRRLGDPATWPPQATGRSCPAPPGPTSAGETAAEATAEAAVTTATGSAPAAVAVWAILRGASGWRGRKSMRWRRRSCPPRWQFNRIKKWPKKLPKKKQIEKNTCINFFRCYTASIQKGPKAPK